VHDVQRAAATAAEQSPIAAPPGVTGERYSRRAVNATKLATAPCTASCRDPVPARPNLASR
jgi:hypothetical protein